MKQLIASNGGKNSTTKKKVITTKKKKVADPNKPNRPMNAFYRFSADYRPKMKKENPDLTSAELVRRSKCFSVVYYLLPTPLYAWQV